MNSTQPTWEAKMGNEASAFDLWVKRDLSRRYGGAVKEPVPEDLLALLDERA